MIRENTAPDPAAKAMRDLASRVCRNCQGWGYDFTSPFNPSEKPQKIVCPDCNGEGFKS